MEARSFALVGTFVCALTSVTAVGCTPPAPTPEKQGSAASKNFAPDPELCATSSPETQADLGIAQWCIYRGQGGVYLAGYSPKGHAVKGLATEYSRKQDGSLDLLRMKLGDGSKFSITHRVGTAQITTKNALGPDSQKLVNAATRDLGTLHAALRQQARVNGALAAPNQCASSMIASLLNSFVGAGMSQGAALALLNRMGAFANLSGTTCLGLSGSGSNGVKASVLPFGGNIGRITPACANDPDPIGCQADFATFASFGRPGGPTFAPDPSIPASIGMPPIFAGGGPFDPAFPSSLGGGPGASSGKGGTDGTDPTASGKGVGGSDPTGSGKETSGASATDDGCGGCTAFSTTAPGSSSTSPGGKEFNATSDSSPSVVGSDSSRQGQIGSQDTSGTGGGNGFGNNGANDPNSAPDFNAGRVDNPDQGAQGQGQIGSQDTSGTGGGNGFGNNGANDPNSAPDFNAGRVSGDSSSTGDSSYPAMNTDPASGEVYDYDPNGGGSGDEGGGGGGGDEGGGDEGGGDEGGDGPG